MVQPTLFQGIGTRASEPCSDGTTFRACSDGFHEEIGTFRACSEPSCVVFRRSRSMGAEHGTDRIGRRARLILHSCNQHVLVGLDDEIAALTARCDPYPISAIGEVQALSDGRATYYLHRGCLERRDRWTIPGHPPSPQLLVLAEHRCDDPLPPAWLAPPSPRPRPVTQEAF